MPEFLLKSSLFLQLQRCFFEILQSVLNLNLDWHQQEAYKGQICAAEFIFPTYCKIMNLKPSVRHRPPLRHGKGCGGGRKQVGYNPTSPLPPKSPASQMPTHPGKQTEVKKYQNKKVASFSALIILRTCHVYRIIGGGRGGRLIVEVACVILSAAVGGCRWYRRCSRQAGPAGPKGCQHSPT